MRFLKVLAVLLVALLLVPTGCIIESGDDDDEQDSDPWVPGDGVVFKASWALEDEGGTGITCGDAGAVYVKTTIVDSASQTYELYAYCNDEEFLLEVDDNIVSGQGTVTMDLITEDETVLSTTGEFSFTVDTADVNDLEIISFVVALWDPKNGADASFNWEWRKAKSDTLEDEYEDTEPFTPEYCEALGIDYVSLYVWNPEANKWWTDSSLTNFSCESSSHPEDDDYDWGAEPYSGLFVEDFLVADTYKMHLGFYREAEGEEQSDMLLYWDSAGSDEDALDGALAADGLDGEVNKNNFYLTIFESDKEEVEFGVLKIKLTWIQSQGTQYDSCDDSSVTEMGFLLRSDGWVAAEVELGNGLECLDWLNFEAVPVLDNDYELLVSGISDENTFLWHHLCSDLQPEVDKTLETATGYECKIDNQLNN